VDVGERTGAWDEVYYSTGDTVADGLRTWFQTQGLLGLKRTSIVGRRLACLCSDCNLYYVRIGVVGSRGEAQTFQQVLQGYRDEGNYAGDEASFRVFSATSKVKRQFRLGGIPDSVVAGNKIDPGFLKSYVYGSPPISGSDATFLGAFLGGGGGIRYRTTSLGGVNSYAIQNASKPVQYGPITLTTNRAGRYDETVKVILSCRGQPQLRGTWKIQNATNPGDIILVGSERVSCPTSVSGFVTLAAYDITSITSAGSAFVNAHKLGKKKFQRRGRQSPKLLRH
jgi:hypothetical protein